MWILFTLNKIFLLLQGFFMLFKQFEVTENPDDADILVMPACKYMYVWIIPHTPVVENIREVKHQQLVCIHVLVRYKYTYM